MSNLIYPAAFREMAYKEADSDYHIAAHVHDSHQWYCVMYGAVETKVNGVPYRLETEQSIIIPPGARREPRSLGKRVGYICSVFVNHRLDLDGISNQVLAMPQDLRPDLHALVAEMRMPIGNDSTDLVMVLFAKLMIGMRRSVTQVDTQSTAKSAQQELVRRLDQYMKQNLSYPLTREDLAKVAKLSPSHLARVYREATGNTLLDRLTELRLDHARILLRESTMPVTSIAMEVGFNSFSHFTQLFKKSVGISPSKFRKTGRHALQ